jgi:hypothetical protein
MFLHTSHHLRQVLGLLKSWKTNMLELFNLLFYLLLERHCVCHICHPNTLCWSGIVVVYSSPKNTNSELMHSMLDQSKEGKEHVMVKTIGKLVEKIEML